MYPEVEVEEDLMQRGDLEVDVGIKLRSLV